MRAVRAEIAGLYDHVSPDDVLVFAGAEEAIEAGRSEMDPEYVPEVAGFYWRAGMAMLAIQNVSAAAGIPMRARQESSVAAAYFRQAAELDPHGYYGGLAAAHLR